MKVKDAVSFILHMLKKREFLIGTIIFFFSVVTFSKILMSSGIPLHGDMSFATTLDNYIDDYFPLYNRFGSVSNYEDIDRSFFMVPFLFISKTIGLSIEWFAKIWLFFTFFFSGISFFIFSDFLFERIYKKKVPPLFLFPGIMVFMLSPWVLEQLQAQFYWLAYAITPLILYFYIRAIEDKSYKYIFFTLITWTLASSTPHYTVLSGLLIFLFFIFSIVKNIFNKEYSDILFKIKLSTLLVALFILINSYWIIPYYQNSHITNVSPGYVVTQEQVQEFSRNSNILNVMRTSDQWITWFNPSIYENSFWIINSFFITILSLSILLINRIRKNFYILYLSFVYLISVILSLGSNFKSYMWLVFDSPVSNLVGWIWRVPGKLSYLIWPIYAIFISIFIYELKINNRLEFIKESLRNFVILLIILSFLVLIGPKVFSFFGFYYVPVEVPHEYQELNDWLSSQAGDFKVMDLAPYEAGSGKNNLKFQSSYTWNEDRIASNLVPRSLVKDSIGFYHYTSPWTKFYSTFYPEIPKNMSSYLSVVGVKYLIYHVDIIGTEEQANMELKKLNESDLRFVKKFGDIYVYENSHFSERVYIPNRIVLTTANLKDVDTPSKNEGYVFINQRIYDLSLLDLLSNTDNKIDFNDYDDLDLSLIPKEHRIEPFGFTYHYKPDEYWSRYKIFNPYEGKYPWHLFLSWRGIVDRYYFDYNEGIIFTFSPGASMTIPFQIEENGNYNFYARMLYARDSGSIEFSLNNRSYRLDTKSSSDHIVWNNILNQNLTKGQNFLKITNLYGTNLINSIVFIQPEKKNEFENQIKKEISANSDIGNNNKTSNYGISKFDNIEKSFSNKNFILHNDNGSIEITSDSPSESLIWSDVPTRPIDIQPGEYLVKYKMKYENVNQSHIHIRNYFSNDTFAMNSVCAPKADSITDWREFMCFIEVPENVKKIQFRLNAGWIKDKKLGNGSTSFGQIEIIPQNADHNRLPDIKEYPAIISNYTIINPTLYNVKINSSKGFMLAFVEAYDPLWTLEIKNTNGKAIQSKVIRPVPLYSVINGFWINQTGNLDITIEYTPQKWFDVGLVISGTTLLGCLTYLGFDFYNERRKKNKKESNPDHPYTETILKLHKENKLSEQEAKKYLENAYDKEEAERLLRMNRE